MFDRVWREAGSYLGCDEAPWTTTTRITRLCCDNRIALRSLDLSRFNIFDLDAFGSPWDQMLILAARRRWLPGETGAVVLTDGSSYHAQFGSLSRAEAALLGQARAGRARKRELSIHHKLIAAWSERAGVTLIRQWHAQGNGSGKGGQIMQYSSFILRGRQ